MGEILFCNQPIAALPYYIEGVSLNVYSLEEMCYFIENNTILLDKDFMTEDLCTWIGKELKNIKLAEKLRDVLRMEGKLSEFIMAILSESGYCTKEITQEILRQIREMEEKTDFECNKVRADRLMEKEKYLSSIYEYKRLLDGDDAGEQPPELLGGVWHNLGTAYARLFLFREAAHCYEKAYDFGKNPESVKECLMAYSCMKDEEGFELAVSKYELEETLVLGVKNELALDSQSESNQAFGEKIEAMALQNANGEKQEYQKEVSNIIFRWKEEYRRICRM